MSPLDRTKQLLAIFIGSLLAILAAFVGSSGAEAPAGDPDYAAGYVVGTGFGYGLVAWVATYFLMLRRGSKMIRRVGSAAILGFAIIGAVLGLGF